jgi:CheY-like chemotaxis protein
MYCDAAGMPAPEQVRQSQKMESIGRLVGGVAHDFANLLTLVAGYTELLLARTSADDPARAELNEIRKATNRGSHLTAQLLGYTRSQSAEPRLIDLNGLILELERLLHPIIGEYVELGTTLDQTLGRIVADPVEIEQVIMNLVLNARDAVNSGGRICIETHNRQVGREEAREHGVDPGEYVELTVSDNGHGMYPETLARVFEPFFTTKQEGKGTGIGLSTVQRIVREHHGDVWPCSLPGKGTTFTVWLPRASAYAEEPAKPVEARAPSSGDESILLVEDEENVRRLLTHILEKRGYRVLSAANAEEALRILAAEGDSIDLLLTDMVMPGMSGRELGDRALQLYPDLPIIYMSGYTDDVLVRTGALKPGMSFLPKPLRPDVLTGKVRDALDSRRRHAAS